MEKREQFIEKAQQLIPKLHETKVPPAAVIEVMADETAFQGWKTRVKADITTLNQTVLGKGDSVMLDFGDHQVGYMTFKLKAVGSPADAPLRLKLIFGEMPCEMGESFDSYEGWLSRSWLQDEIINVDVLPCELTLPRRYAFRYVKLIVLETSVKYKIVVEDAYCTAVTSADRSKLQPLPANCPASVAAMDRIGIRTLENCMQTVFEDGPKRDRRLWIGDLRLQALANYYTFGNSELVKRCLYLFAGLTLEESRVGACLFEQPAPHVDDTKLFDYSLFFVCCLYDYYEATNDREFVEELWHVAIKQIELSLARVADNGIVRDTATWWCFVDWHPELNKQAAAQAVLIYSLKRALSLAEMLKLQEPAQQLAQHIRKLSQAALDIFYDEAQGFFVSGEQHQVSWATQVWMVLAEILPPADNYLLMQRLYEDNPSIRLNTPYMYHHLVEALITVGNKEKALEQLQAYWGEMVRDGADTFWEVYNPDDKKLSPYGSNLINSYCHAWSCTPAYFIRKYFAEEYGN